MDEENESFERAIADVEMLTAAYPEEITTATGSEANAFPITFTIHLEDSAAFIKLELTKGYPTETGVQVSSYRSLKPQDKRRMEQTVAAIRRVSEECQQDGLEGGFACCSAALEVWNGSKENDEEGNQTELSSSLSNNGGGMQSPSAPIVVPKLIRQYQWITGNSLVDRKSTFQAHLCHVTTEQEVREALQQLVDGSTKIQRATHNMYAWRVTELNPTTNVSIVKHDNEDDGEDLAGSKLAFLLDMRKDDNVLVVVSRWYGGIHLGPKRFAHIVNVARELLVQYCDGNWNGKQATNR